MYGDYFDTKEEAEKYRDLHELYVMIPFYSMVKKKWCLIFDLKINQQTDQLRRKQMIHSLKTETRFFEDVKSGKKNFEIRKNDRGYEVGDYLALNEWENDAFTGRSILVKVTYIFSEERLCKEGFVTMAIKPCQIVQPGRFNIPSPLVSEEIPVYGKADKAET